VVIVLDFRSEGQWFDTQSLPLCYLLRQETLPHMSLSTQVYKWVLVTYCWGSATMDYHPIQGEKQYSHLLHATQTRLSSGPVGLLGSYVTWPTIHIKPFYEVLFEAPSLPTPLPTHLFTPLLILISILCTAVLSCIYGWNIQIKQFSWLTLADCKVNI